MPYSNFPNGFKNGVAIQGVPLFAAHSGGNVFWVDSNHGGSNGNPGTWTRPFATLDYAIGRCTASNGDIIMVKPGHAEAISSATALAFDKAGITIIGVGEGSQRPTFTLDTANTATISVTASGVTVQNCIFVGNFLSIATVFTVSGAADFVVDSCEFRDTSAILGFLSVVTTVVSTNTDGLTFTRNKVSSVATSSGGPPVVIANTIARLTITDNVVFATVANNNTSKLLEHGALVVSQGLVARNRVFSANTDTATGAILIKTTATTGQGLVYDNYVRTRDAAAAIMVTAAAVQWGCFNNYHQGDATTTSGWLLPAVGTDT